VPESRSRKKAEYTPPTGSKKAVRVGSRRWIAPAMVACWIFGLAWIVVFYIAPDLKEVVYFGIFLLILVLKPNGLFGVGTE